MKIKHFLLISFFLFFLESFAFASFSIQTDLTSIDFGNMKPGDIKGDLPPQGITVTCTSDRGNQWFLRIRLENPLSNTSDPSATIASENFFWYGKSTTGQGTLAMDEQDFTQERVVYTALLGEGSSGVDILLRFKLRIPQYTAAGTYATRIILTLIE